MDDEYYEVFGGGGGPQEDLPIKIQQVLNSTSEASQIENECQHEKVEKFPNGRGFCISCGINFADVNNIQPGRQACSHENTYEDDNGLYVCKDCGQELEMFTFKPEWRYYKSGEGGGGSRDPSRCHKTKGNRSLDKVFDEHGIVISDAMKAHTEVKYFRIADFIREQEGKNTMRGKGRKAIIAACLLHTFLEFGEYRTSDYIRHLFDITKKNMSSGLKDYYRVFEDDRTRHIRPENLIHWLLSLTGIGQLHYPKIVKIAQYLENSSRVLEHSSPQSVASAIIYFYLCLNPDYKNKLGITKSKFAEKALLSDITISKLVKEAASVANCEIEL